MNEIEKMYENAGILKECLSPCYINKTWRKTHDCPNCDNRENYPPFTAEKQINIIKWLLKSYDIGLSQLGERIDTSLDGVNCISGLGSGNTFEESLAQAINDLWQDLTEQERTEIADILRG